MKTLYLQDQKSLDLFEELGIIEKTGEGGRYTASLGSANISFYAHPRLEGWRPSYSGATQVLNYGR